MRAALLATLLALLPASARAEEFVHEPQGWLAFFGTRRLADTAWVFWLDAHVRVYGNATTAALLLRPGVGVRVRPDMTVWLGYAWTPLVSGGAVTLDEHRLWEQWTWELSFANGMRAQLRSRLEQRLARGQLGVRFRQFARVQSPRFGRAILAAWDEIFFAFNDTAWGQQAGFDQNRAFAGVGVFLDDAVRLEAGYLNRLVHRRDAPDPVHHAALVSLFASW